MSTPSEELSKKIVAKLVDSKLIAAADVSQLTTDLSQGKLRPEDWRLLIEKGMDVEARTK